MTLLDDLLAFLFPPLCLSCGGALTNPRAIACPACWDSISRPGADDPTRAHTWEALRGEEGMAGLAAPFLFDKDGAVQALIHRLKYDGATKAGVLLGMHVGEAVRRDFPEESVVAIVPVPLHPARRRERGYNQAEWIARGVGQVLAAPVAARVIERRRWTHTQTTLHREERQENVRDAFAVRRHRREELREGTVVLVDDVITTGATICACARALRRAGACRVVAAAVALAR